MEKTISELIAIKFPGSDQNTMIDRIVYRNGGEDALNIFKNKCMEEGFWNSKLDEFLDFVKC